MIETRPVHELLRERCQKELAMQFRIFRGTANKVLAKLASESWLELRKGLGT